MIQKYSNLKIYGSICFIFVLLTINCNSISEDVRVAKSVFIDENKIPVFKHDTLFIFNFTVGNQVNLSGTRSCTTYVNNTVTLTHNDSIYRRISTLNPVLLNIGDSTYGRATIKNEDIANWSELLLTFQDTARVLGNILKTYLDSNISAAIQSHNSAEQITAPEKDSVVNTLHELLNNEFLLYKYKTALLNEIKLLPDAISSLQKDILHMVNTSVFLDTLGSVKPLYIMSDSERESIRWFNRKIITYYLDHPTSAAGIVTIFTKYSLTGRIYPVLFQQNTSNNMDTAKSIIRYLKVNNALMSQLAYTDEYGFHSLINDETKVFNYMWTTDIDSSVTPLFWSPDISFISADKVPDLLISGDAVMEHTGSSQSNDTVYYNFKTFYGLSGSILYNDEPLQVNGTIKTITNIVKFPGNDQGYISGWNSVIWIQGNIRDGTNLKYIGHYVLKSLFTF